MRTYALIPAAGLSRRMGQPKLALPLGERTVLERVVAAVRAGGVEQVLVVLGPATAFLKPLAEQSGAQVHVVPQETADMRATVEAGLAWIEGQHHPQPEDAWLLVPADHPTLDPEIVATLIDVAPLYRERSIFVPIYGDRRGHPTLLHWRHVVALRQLPAGQGLNAYIRAQPDQTMGVSWHNPEVLSDLDTPEDYERLCRGFL